MATHYSQADDGGNITVTYDTPEEDPSYREAGQAIELRDDREVIVTFGTMSCHRFDQESAQIIGKLHNMAQAKLAPGTIYEIRGRLHTEYGRRRGLAWYTSHWLQSEEPTGAIAYPGKTNELGGYNVLGSFRVPHG